MDSRYPYTKSLLLAVLTTVLLDAMSTAIDGVTIHEVGYIIEHELHTLNSTANAAPEVKSTFGILLVSADWRALLTDAVIAAVLFHAHIWLERLLPTRRRQSSTASGRQSISKVTDDDPALEEEVIRRLIAQGKIKRASASWCNITIKWMLINVTPSYARNLMLVSINIIQGRIGIAHMFTLDKLILPLAAGLFGMLSPRSLATLLCLIAAPVEHRVQYTALAGVLSSILIGLFVHWNMRWIAQTDLAVQVLREFGQQQTESQSESDSILVPLIFGTTDSAL